MKEGKKKEKKGRKPAPDAGALKLAYAKPAIRRCLSRGGAKPAGHGLKNMRVFQDKGEDVFEMDIYGAVQINVAATPSVYVVAYTTITSVFPILGELWNLGGAGLFQQVRFMSCSAQASPVVTLGTRTLSGIYSISASDGTAVVPVGVDLLNNTDSMIYAAPAVSATPYDISSQPWCSKKSMTIRATKGADQALWYPDPNSSGATQDYFVLGYTCAGSATPASFMILSLKAQFKGISFAQ